MNSLQPLHAGSRAPRFSLAEITPAVLQFEDYRLAAGELQLISRNGGLLSLPALVDKGSVVTLMFRTHKGPVFAAAEMLPPVSERHQPFRFSELDGDDQNRLQAAFQSGLFRNLKEEEWMEELRASIVHWDPPPPPRRFLKPVLVAVTLATLGLASVLCVFSAHLR